MPAANTKKDALRKGMLHYFNQVLLQENCLTEEQYRRMQFKIEQMREKHSGQCI